MNILKILCVFIFSTSVFAINVEETIKSTIEKNPKVKIALEKLNESKELIIFSKGLKLPTVTGKISGVYKNADTTTSTTSTTPETFTDSYKLTVSKNLYDAGINNLDLESSKILFNNELINFQLTIQDLILVAIEGYLTVINNEKSLEANKKNYDSISKAYQEINTRFETGTATLYDVQEAEASFAIAKTNLYAAEQNFLISKQGFKRIVGLSANNLDDSVLVKKQTQLKEITNNALNNNLNLILISNNIKSKEILILKEKKNKMPTLDLTGTGLYSNGSRIEKGSETTSGSIDLTLTIPLFQKSQQNSNIRKYRSQMLQSEISFQDYSDDLRILILNTYKDFKISESKMKSNKVVIKSIETALKSLNEEYSLGTKTIKDLVEQEEKLLNANVNFLNSKKEYLLNYFEIKSLDGSLIKLFDKYLPSIN